MSTAPRKATQVKASDLENGINFENEKWIDRRSRRKIQKRELRRILTFFIAANICTGVLVTIMALIEHFTPTTHPIITDKVVIAALAGITLQAGGIILAAFKGLFSEKR
jgi:hypothetical protein